jgi:NTE family protein
MKKILFTIVFISFTLIAFSQAKPKNLVFEGGGIRGIAYAGVVYELEHGGYMSGIEKVGGTSAGAITALFIALDYKSSEIEDIISQTEFKEFNDGQYMFIGGISRFKETYGWYRHGEFDQWLEKVIKDKTGNADITFEELSQKGFRDLYITATCLNKQKLLVFSKENYPNMKVKDAVVSSMSIPLYFEAVFIDSAGNRFDKQNAQNTLDVVVDGGILGNYPIFLFDETITDSLGQTSRIPNPYTIGVRIDTENQIKNDSINQELVEMPINDITGYMNAFYNIIIENLNRPQLNEQDWKRTISVSSVGIGPKIKNLSEEQKNALVESGKKSARKYLTNLE